MLLAPLVTTGPLDFPYMRARELAVGEVPCLALRVTYVGELGWELYCPSEFGLALWDTLWDGGREHGLVAGGYKAIDSLRLEKGYRVWGADITSDDTPYEAGLGFAVKLDKDFVGRTRSWPAGRAGAAPRVSLLADPRSVALGSEPVRVDGRLVGRVTSGGYGYTVERSIAYAYLPAADAGRGRGGRGRDLRRLGCGRGGVGAALGPARRADPLLACTLVQRPHFPRPWSRFRPVQPRPVPASAASSGCSIAPRSLGAQARPAATEIGRASRSAPIRRHGHSPTARSPGRAMRPLVEVGPCLAPS